MPAGDILMKACRQMCAVEKLWELARFSLVEPVRGYVRVPPKP